MGIRIISILILVLMLFIVSCKWFFKAEGKAAVEPAAEDIKVTAARAVEEVSKATGRSAAEIKALSKGDLDKIAEEAKSSAEATCKITADSGSNKKKSEFIDEISKSAGKLDLAFKSLVGAGYEGDLASPVLSNIKTGLGNLELAKKLAEIEENSDYTKLEEVKKAVGKLGGDTGSCVNTLSSKQGHSEPVKNGLKECIAKLMSNVNSNFDTGVQQELDDNRLGDVPDKFKDALKTLRGAAFNMQQAASKVQFK